MKLQQIIFSFTDCPLGKLVTVFFIPTDKAGVYNILVKADSKTLLKSTTTRLANKTSCKIIINEMLKRGF